MHNIQHNVYLVLFMVTVSYKLRQKYVLHYFCFLHVVVSALCLEFIEPLPLFPPSPSVVLSIL